MKCKICGKNCEKEYCFQHKPRKKIYPKALSKEELSKVFDDVVKMRKVFYSIWSKRKHYSEISNIFLGHEALTIFFHHILPKGEERFEIAALDEENIILLTLDEHTNVENDMYRYPEINKQREYLLIKYGIE